MPTNIQHATTDPTFDGAYTRSLEITADDFTDLEEVTRAINVHIPSSGSVQIAVTLAGDPDGFPRTLNLVHATIAPLRVKRLWSTGTDAGAVVVALY